jgi:hypothetical protein
MRKAMILMLFALAILPCAAGATSVGLGAFGGPSIPIIQDDNGSGTQFGVRVPVTLLPLVTVEPYYVKGTGDSKDQEVDGQTFTRSGIDVSGFGANLLLTFGGKFQMYPYAGIGSYKLSRTGSEDQTNTAYTFGLGFGLSPMAKISIHVRGELAAAVEGAVSRKWANATVGVSYNIFSTPAH